MLIGNTFNKTTVLPLSRFTCRPEYITMTVSGVAESTESQSPAKMADIEGSLSGLRNFSWLMGVVLIFGVFANAYLVWLSARRCLSVRWETFNLILHYSSVVDMSLCVLLASFVMWSSVMSYARCDVTMSFHCGDFQLASFPIYGGVIMASSGGIFAARQAIMLHAFESEITVLRQTRMRVVTVLSDLAVAGVVCLLGAVLMANFGPDVHLRMCYVIGTTIPSHAATMVLAPSVIILVLCSVVIARSTRTDNEYDRQEMLDISDDSVNSAKDVEGCMTSLEDFPDQDGDSRCCKFVVVLRMAVVASVILAAVMSLAGVLMQPVSVHEFVVLVGSAALTSVWSAYAITRHWTLN